MRLAVVGAGGHGRVVAESAVALGWDIVFFDDGRVVGVDGWSVMGKFPDLLGSPAEFDGVFVAIGNNRMRLEWIRQLRVAGAKIATIIDPTCHVSRSALIGEGTFLARGAIVSTGAVVGAACIINTAASVDHDCRVGDAVHLSPGVRLSGTVTVGEASWLGTGSAVRNNIAIGPNVIVGAGGVVVNDIPGDQTVVGIPARPLEKN